MRTLKLAPCICAALALNAFAAVMPYQIIGVLPGAGSDTNSGEFVSILSAGTACSGGTDYTTSATAHVVFDGATITATTVGVSKTITITGYTVATTDICNTVRVTGGTNFTAALYQIDSVNVGANTWTLDANVATGVGVGMTGRMGGGLATLAKAFADMAAYQTAFSIGSGTTIWYKAGTETLTSTITEPDTANVIVHGYQTTRGDNTGTRPLITSATNSVALITAIANFNHSSMTFDNVSFSHTAGTRGNCFASATNTYARAHVIVNSVLDGCLYGIKADSSTQLPMPLTVIGTEIKNCVKSAIADSTVNVYGSYLHDNTESGIIINTPQASIGLDVTVANSVISNNAVDGINVQATDGVSKITVTNTDFYNNPNAIFMVSGFTGSLSCVNCVFEASSTAAINYSNGSGGLTPASGPIFRLNNAFFNNTANLSPPLLSASSSDITLTSSPFTNAAGNNYALNSTAGGGASLKATGFPGAIPGAGTGYTDVGALQSQAATGGSSSAFVQ